MSAYKGLGDLIGGGGESRLDDMEPVAFDDSGLEGDIEIIENDDGTVTVMETGETERECEEIPEDLAFDANLAPYLSEQELADIGASVCRDVERDIEANAEWRATFNDGLKFLGFKPDDRDWLFKGASGAWDTKLLEAMIRFHAEIFGELFPADGPMRTKIIGIDNETLQAQASRVESWGNYYLTRVAREYYDDSEQMLNYVLLAGSAFRKVYICPILNRPVSKYITPNQCAMPYSATGIWDTPRFTHICDDLQPRDLKLMQLSGYYLDVMVSRDTDRDDDKDELDKVSGMSDTEDSTEGPYTVYETLCDYDLPRFEHLDEDGEPTGLPLPYTITVAPDGTVLRIQRAWDEEKASVDGLYVRKLNIAHYKFMPGFGPFGIGLIHCLGGSAEFRTKIKRMLHDGGVFANFPPTIRVKGMRMEHNTAGIAPGSNIEMDTGGIPINQAIQQLSVKEPSMMLKALYDDEASGADRLIGNMDISVGDGRQDAPVGTTMALLAAAKKPQTGVMKRLHRALTHELEMICALFGRWLPEAPYPYQVWGDQRTVMAADFNSGINPIPVSDPNMMSQTERMMRGEMITRLVGQLPPNAPPHVIEAARRMLVLMGVDQPEKLLPPGEAQAAPTDPVTENMNAAQGKPLQAFIEQNHDAHIAVHTPMSQASPALQAHITEHMAMKYKVAVENMLGFAFPAEGSGPQPADVQERIAMLAAQATEAYMAKMKAQEPPPPPSVEEVMVMDVEQKREKEKLRHEAAMAKFTQEDEMAALKYDNAAAERAVKMNIARMKTTASLVTDEEKLKSAARAEPKTPPVV